MFWTITAGSAVAIIGIIAVFVVLRLGIAAVGKTLELAAWLFGKLLLLLVRIPFWIYDGIAWLITEIPYRFGRYGTWRYARALRRNQRRALSLAERERTSEIRSR
ncbi:MAG: hypothetical protein ACTH8F_08375 [Microbacterium sp.]|uniref:hypothetical protein n=1 Tax=Microbacterium sp. TaxID=51671 RepID=UPI003F99AC5F